MEALLSHCVRSDGERLDPALSPAPSVLAEDGRGTLYALGADGVIRASPARHVNAAIRGAIDADTAATLTVGGGVRAAVRAFRPSPAVDFEPRAVSVSPPATSPPSAACDTRRPPPAPLHPPPSPSSPSETRHRRRDASRPRPRPGCCPGCHRVALLEEEFERHPSVRVLRAAWHPSSDGHPSSSSPTVPFACSTPRRVPRGTGVPPRSVGTRTEPGSVPLRPEIVDFAFAPPHGWGALSLVLPRPRGRRVHHVSVHAVGGEVPARHHAESHAAGRRHRALAGRDVPDAARRRRSTSRPRTRRGRGLGRGRES